jgi:hypothetical protein
MALSAAAVAAPGSADEPAAKPPALSPLAEAQVQAIIAKHAAKIMKEQKDDLKRLVAGTAKTSEKLHAYALPENSEPALAFRVFRADRR